MQTVLEILGSLGFNWKVALANLVNFLLVFYLLNKFIFSKLGSVIKERREAIDKGLEDAQKAETELLMAEKRSADVINDATQQANAVLADAREQEKAIISDVENKAIEKARLVAEKTKKEIEEERKNMEKKLEKQTAILAVQAAERILEKSLDENKNNQLIKETLSR